MLSERGRRKLIDIRRNILLAQQWTDGTDPAQFGDDVKTVYAVVRALEIISEASRSVDADTKARFPAIPWVDIAGAGNIYRHDYDSVEEDLIWASVRNALPPLLAAVEAELGPEA
jgi:uncharacterized protein with HEPN domain